LQVADAVAVPPVVSGTEEPRVDAGDLPFLAMAAEATPRASGAVSASTAARIIRQRK
jgi:hypothetical protein